MSELSGTDIERAGSPGLLSARFLDFDELSAAVAEWDLDFVQLDAGPAPSALTQVSTPDLLIQRFRFDRTYLQRGASPTAMRTFGLLEPDAEEIRMFGKKLTDSELALFRTGGEFEAVSRPGCVSLAISLDAARLDEAFAAVDLSPSRGREAMGSGLLEVDPKVLQRLRRRAAGLLDLLETNPSALGGSELLEEITFALAIDLALAIASADGPPHPAPSRFRDFALRRAVSIIGDHPKQPIAIRQLAEETGVGWTTLVQAFRDHFGVTPKAYLQAVRLNCVRRDLLEAELELRVADVANRWGFWHMGQFAADYKRLFGELPSETKNRTLGPWSG